jgi:hypothetical protein
MTPEHAENIRRLAHEEVGKPKAERYVEEAEGEYNAVGLPSIPSEIVSVVDEDGELQHRVVGQQIVFDRRPVPPVVIEYVSVSEGARWKAALENAIRRLSKE